MGGKGVGGALCTTRDAPAARTAAARATHIELLEHCKSGGAEGGACACRVRRIVSHARVGVYIGFWRSTPFPAAAAAGSWVPPAAVPRTAVVVVVVVVVAVVVVVPRRLGRRGHQARGGGAAGQAQGRGLGERERAARRRGGHAGEHPCACVVCSTGSVGLSLEAGLGPRTPPMRGLTHLALAHAHRLSARATRIRCAPPPPHAAAPPPHAFAASRPAPPTHARASGLRRCAPPPVPRRPRTRALAACDQRCAPPPPITLNGRDARQARAGPGWPRRK